MSEAPQPKPEATPSSPADHPSRSGKSRSSVTQFLGALILMLFVAPFVNDFEYGPAIDTALITLVLILGVLAVGRSRKSLVLAMILMIPALSARWIHHFQPHLFPAVIENISALVFIGFVEFQLLHFIFRTPRVNS